MKEKLLLVGEESPSVSRVGDDLVAAGFDLELAPDGFYSALWLERNRAAAVLVLPPLPDMAVEDFAGILACERERPNPPRWVLVVPSTRTVGNNGRGLFDLVCPKETVLPRLRELLGRKSSSDAGRGGVAPSLRGSFGAIDFAHLVQFLADTRRAGVLRISLAGSEAAVFFLRGEVTHCFWSGLEGLRAFREILRSSAIGDAPFDFEATSPSAGLREPRTLGGPVARLLLEAAVEIDGDRRPVRRAKPEELRSA